MPALRDWKATSFYVYLILRWSNLQPELLFVILSLLGSLHRYSTWHSRFGTSAGNTVTIPPLTKHALCDILATAWPQLPPTSPAENTFQSDLPTLHLTISNFRLDILPTWGILHHRYFFMAALFQAEQVLIGQAGKYRILKQLQKAVWLAKYETSPYFITTITYVNKLPHRTQAHKDVIIKSVQGHPRVANERDVLKIFTPRSKYIRPLLDEIVDPAEPTTIVLSHLQSTLLQSSVRQKLSRTELKYVCHGVLEALAAMHSEGYVHAGKLCRWKHNRSILAY